MKLPPTAHTSSSSTNSRTNGRRRFFWLLQAQRGNARCKPERLHGYHLGTSVTSRPVSMGKPDGGGEAHALHPRPETARVCSPPDVAQGGRNGRNLINTLPPSRQEANGRRGLRARAFIYSRDSHAAARGALTVLRAVHLLLAPCSKAHIPGRQHDWQTMATSDTAERCPRR